MKVAPKLDKWQRQAARERVKQARALDRAYVVLEGIRGQFRGADKYESNAITNAQDVVAARAARLRAIQVRR